MISSSIRCQFWRNSVDTWRRFSSCELIVGVSLHDVVADEIADVAFVAVEAVVTVPNRRIGGTLCRKERKITWQSVICWHIEDAKALTTNDVQSLRKLHDYEMFVRKMFTRKCPSMDGFPSADVVRVLVYHSIFLPYFSPSFNLHFLDEKNQQILMFTSCIKRYFPQLKFVHRRESTSKVLKQRFEQSRWDFGFKSFFFLHNRAVHNDK